MHSVCHGQIYIFMDFLHLVKKKAGALLRDYGYAMVENKSLVSHDGKIANKFHCATPPKSLDFAMEQINATTIVPKNEIVGNSVIRQAFQNTTIPPGIANVTTDSWRTETKR